MSEIKAYIAGPMRGYENFNFDAFDAAAKMLRAEGIHPISPTDIDRMMEGWGQYPPEDLEVDKALKTRCIMRDLAVIAYELDGKHGDFLYLLKGWEPSSGANLELAAAKYFGVSVVRESPCEVIKLQRDAE